MTLTREDFAAHVTAWLEQLPSDQHDWAEALLAAALDETHGDLGQSLQMARVAYAEDSDVENSNPEGCNQYKECEGGEGGKKEFTEADKAKAKEIRTKAFAEYKAADEKYSKLYQARVTDHRLEMAEHERDNAHVRSRWAGSWHNHVVYGDPLPKEGFRMPEDLREKPAENQEPVSNAELERLVYEDAIKQLKEGGS